MANLFRTYAIRSHMTRGPGGPMREIPVYARDYPLDNLLGKDARRVSKWRGKGSRQIIKNRMEEIAALPAAEKEELLTGMFLHSGYFENRADARDYAERLTDNPAFLEALLTHPDVIEAVFKKGSRLPFTTKGLYKPTVEKILKLDSKGVVEAMLPYLGHVRDEAPKPAEAPPGGYGEETGAAGGGVPEEGRLPSGVAGGVGGVTIHGGDFRGGFVGSVITSPITQNYYSGLSPEMQERLQRTRNQTAHILLMMRRAQQTKERAAAVIPIVGPGAAMLLKQKGQRETPRPVDETEFWNEFRAQYGGKLVGTLAAIREQKLYERGLALPLDVGKLRMLTKYGATRKLRKNAGNALLARADFPKKRTYPEYDNFVAELRELYGSKPGEIVPTPDVVRASKGLPPLGTGTRGIPKTTASEIMRTMRVDDVRRKKQANRGTLFGMLPLFGRATPRTITGEDRDSRGVFIGRGSAARIQELMAGSPKELENNEIWRSMTPREKEEALSRFERDERNRLFERLGTAPQSLNNSELKRLLLIVGHQRGTHLDAMRKAVILEWNKRKKK